VVTTWMGEDR